MNDFWFVNVCLKFDVSNICVWFKFLEMNKIGVVKFESVNIWLDLCL